MRRRLWSFVCVAALLGCAGEDPDDEGRFGGGGSVAYGGGGGGAGGSSGDGGYGNVATGGNAGVSGSSGSGGASGGSGGGGGTGGYGGTGGASCNDPGPEPNELPTAALQACKPDLGMTGCTIEDPDADGSSTRGPITGVIGGSDVDYFTFVGIDTSFGAAAAHASTTDTFYRLCVFVECKDGTALTLNSCTSGTVTPGPAGLQGCCSFDGEVQPNHECPAWDDSVRAYVRIDGATKCGPYTVNYNF